MLILYVASPDTAHLLDEPCKAAGLLLRKQTGTDISLVKLVKLRNLSGYSMLAFDLAAICYDERELDSAVYSVQMMYPNIRVVVLSLDGEHADTLRRLQSMGVENIAQDERDIPLCLSLEGMRNAVIREKQPEPSIETEDEAHGKRANVKAQSEHQTDANERLSLIVPPSVEMKDVTPLEPVREPMVEQMPERAPMPMQAPALEPSPVAPEPITDKLSRAEQPAPRPRLCLRPPKPQKPRVSIGVCGLLHRIGTTTHALGFTDYLIGEGTEAIYVEGNGHGHIAWLSQYYDVEEDARGLEVCAGIPIARLDAPVPDGARALVYDLGVYGANRDAFAECDIKVLCVGAKPWELSWLGKLFQEEKPAFLSQIRFIFSFLDEREREQARRIMGQLAAQTHFAGYSPSFFNAEFNHGMYRVILDKAIE